MLRSNEFFDENPGDVDGQNNRVTAGCSPVQMWSSIWAKNPRSPKCNSGHRQVLRVARVEFGDEDFWSSNFCLNLLMTVCVFFSYNFPGCRVVFDLFCDFRSIELSWLLKIDTQLLDDWVLCRCSPLFRFPNWYCTSWFRPSSPLDQGELWHDIWRISAKI